MLLSTLFCFTGAALAIPAPSNSSRSCKVTPFDSEWPSIAEWNSLNSSIGGRLLQTTPVASSCWTANPFGSQVPCDIVDANWTNSKFHASLPESVGAPIFANNSCLPPDGNGFLESKGCHLGGLPSYIVNATTEQQVATAMKWAAKRNMRIVVKGTGHELNGRQVESLFLPDSSLLTLVAGRPAPTLCQSGLANSTISAAIDLSPC